MRILLGSFHIRLKLTDNSDLRTNVWIIVGIFVITGKNKFKPLLAADRGIGNYASEVNLIRHGLTVCISCLIKCKLSVHFDRFADVILRSNHHIINLRVHHRAAEFC